ncbi:MAG: hypothetical protein JRI68_03140, partial [Deltaproteobacteria bacterium]|nr:hypothetical protein [Deltaproteobacteria bacterium]
MAEQRELSSRSIAVHRLGLRRRIGFGIMAASVALFGTVLLPFNPGPLFFLGLFAFLGLPIGAIVATTARRDPGAGDGHVGSLRLEDERLTAEYAQVKYELTVDELDSGWIEEAVRGASLVLRTKQRDIIEARLDDADARVAAKGLLQALDL